MNQVSPLKLPFQLLDAEAGSTQQPWIAAMATTLPREFVVGDGSVDRTGKFRNKRLEKGRSYRIFVRSYVRDGVSLIYLAREICHILLCVLLISF